MVIKVKISIQPSIYGELLRFRCGPRSLGLATGRGLTVASRMPMKNSFLYNSIGDKKVEVFGARHFMSEENTGGEMKRTVNQNQMNSLRTWR
jgi:hypothetical protein